MKLKVLLEYVASFLFLSGLVLFGGSLGLLSCNVLFSSGFYFALMFTFGVVFTLSGKCLGHVVGGGEND